MTKLEEATALFRQLSPEQRERILAAMRGEPKDESEGRPGAEAACLCVLEDDDADRSV